MEIQKLDELTTSDTREGKDMKRIVCAGLLIVELLIGSSSHAGKVTYIHTDPQGTPVMESDAQGHITARYDYKPYGMPAQAMSGSPDGPGYTGHVNDPDTGLVYMQARYYDPHAGIFLSTDPVRPLLKDVLGFGRYTYVQNNPINSIDPDGRYHCTENQAGDFCGKVDNFVGAIKTARNNLRSSGGHGSDVKLLTIALKQIGEKGQDGPTYVSGSLDTAAAHTDQKGTTTIDVAKIDAKGSASDRYGAQAIAHEARHDYDVNKSGLKTTETQVRETETNAYKTSRAVDRGYGLDWKSNDFKNAVETSVELWKDEK